MWLAGRAFWVIGGDLILSCGPFHAAEVACNDFVGVSSCELVLRLVEAIVDSLALGGQIRVFGPTGVRTKRSRPDTLHV